MIIALSKNLASFIICFKISLLSVEALNLKDLILDISQVASAIVVFPQPGLPYKMKENK